MKNHRLYLGTALLSFFLLTISGVAASPQVIQDIITLEPNEELVYGKVAPDGVGGLRYSFAVTRRPNAEKEIFEREFHPYGPEPILGGGAMRPARSVADYDRYDFFVIFNGQRMGPYDRIVDIQQQDPDVDSWISPDGTKINFTAVIGQRYWVIVNNRQYLPYWSHVQMPIIATAGESFAAGMLWARNDWRLFVNNNRKYDGLNHIFDLEFSHQGQLAYSISPDARSQRYVHVGEDRFGPFTFVPHFSTGFIPGSDTYHFAAQNSLGERFLYVGGQQFEIPSGFQVSRVDAVEGRVGVVLGSVDSSNRQQIIQEYDNRTGMLDTIGRHTGSVQIQQFNGQLFYTVLPEGGGATLLQSGGRVLQRVPVSERQVERQSFYVTASGDILYTQRSGSGRTTRATVLLNGNPVSSIDGVVANVQHVSSNSTGTLQLVANLDQEVASNQRRIVYGSRVWDVTGEIDFSQRLIQFADEAQTFYWVRRFDNGLRWQLYHENRPVSDRLGAITELVVSPNGQRYAYLSGTSTESMAMLYYPENTVMNIQYQLIVDGQRAPGRTSAPVYCHVHMGFLVLQQSGRDVALVRM